MKIAVLILLLLLLPIIAYVLVVRTLTRYHDDEPLDMPEYKDTGYTFEDGV
jgi:hypothetical protein